MTEASRRSRLLTASLVGGALLLGAAVPGYGQSADLGVAKADSPDPVAPGRLLSYDITVTNAGPDDATSLTLSDTIPAGTTFDSLNTEGALGWSCTTPMVGAGGTVSCSAAILTSGASALFSLHVRVDPAVTDGTTIVNTATVASGTADPNPGNESATAMTTVLTQARVSLLEAAQPDPVPAGTDLTYTLDVLNDGPGDAADLVLTDTLPADTTFRSLGSPPDWSCVTPPIGGTGTVICSAPVLPAGEGATFSLVVRVSGLAAPGATIGNTATVSSSTSDPAPGDESATVSTRVIVRALAFGAGAGGGPHVKVFNRDTLDEVWSLFAHEPGFTGGVRVAVGDVSGDGQADVVTGAGPGGGPHVKVFDPVTRAEIRSFFAYDAAFAGGVFVAAGDVNGDGQADVVTGAGAGGGPHVRVFDGVTGAELMGFFAYDPAFAGGVTVAAGDVNGDGLADIVTGAGPGGGPHVRVFDGATGAELHGFYAYQCDDHVLGPCFRGGVFVTAADVNGDGRADVITGAGPGGEPRVRVFDGATGAALADFLAYDALFDGGVRVAAGDVDGDGAPDVLTGAGPGGGPHFRAFDGVTLGDVAGFFAFGQPFTGGIFVGGQ